MISSRQILAPLAAATLLLAGCNDPAAGEPKDPWPGIAHNDLNCPSEGSEKVISKARHNVYGDERDEWFVVFRCGDQEPDQVEVFPGDAAPVSSRRTGKLSHNGDRDRGKLLNLDGGCLYFTRETLIIRAHRFEPPQGPVLRVVTWKGEKPVIAADLHPATVEFPGC
jgi:hypothetical protein